MKKVAIVNRTNLLNFGSVLQVLALAEATKSLGYDADVIWERGTVSKNFDLRPRKILSIVLNLIRHPRFIHSTFHDLKYVSSVDFSEKTVTLFSDFVNKYINRKFYVSTEINQIGKSELYHKFICGSDQVWNSTTLYPDPLMYLRFAKEEKRVAYAPSFGRSYIPDYNKRKLKKYISQIPNLSIRETDGAYLIKNLIGINVPVVLDPTLLFDKYFWLNYSVFIADSDYILCYFLNEPSKSVQDEIKKYAKGRKIVILRSVLHHIKESYNNCVHPDAGPAEFIGYISDADFIFTDSYHGMLFSINFEKEFLSVERTYGEFDQSSRQKSILNLLGITENYNNTGKISNSTLDYNQIKYRLKELRNTSYQYLRDALQ